MILKMFGTAENPIWSVYLEYQLLSFTDHEQLKYIPT